MVYLVIALVCLVIFYYFFSNKLRIDFKSFFKKGFARKTDDFGLFCYTGKQGKGKTFSAIQFLEKQRVRYKQVLLTNVKSYYDYVYSTNTIDCYYFEDIEELIELAISLNNNNIPIIVFFDEIFTVLTKNVKIQKHILSFISQLRKRQIIFVTTAQEWAEINMTFRRYIRYQISCNMFSIPILKIAFYFNSINDGDGIRWDESEQDFMAPLIFKELGKANLNVVKKYDTFETIATNK